MREGERVREGEREYVSGPASVTVTYYCSLESKLGVAPLPSDS